MFSLLRERNFSLLWFGQLFSMVGDWLLMTALPYYVYQETGLAVAAGAMFLVQVLPRLLVGTVAGVFADRWDNRRTMIVADLLRAAVLLLLFLVPTLGWLWVVYVVGFMESLLSQFYYPADRALFPRLVARDRLREANSFFSIGGNFARIMGPLAGGAVMATFGLTSVVLIDSITYVLCALFIILIRLPEQQGAKAKVSGGARAGTVFTGIWKDWLDGLKLLKNNRFLTSVFLVAGLAMLGDAMLSPMFVVYVENVLKAGPTEFGWMLTARGVGGVLAGVLIGSVGKKLASHQMIIFGTALTALTLAVLANFPNLVLAIAALAFIALPALAWMITTETLLQQATTDEYRGRVFGAFGTTTAVTMIVGISLASFLGDMIGTTATLNVAAGVTLLSTVVALVMLRPATGSEQAHEQPHKQEMIG